MRLRSSEDGLHQGAAVVDELLQSLTVGLEVADRPRGHAGLHGGLGDGGRNLHDEARVEGFRNEVFGAERQVFDAAVGGGDNIALFLTRKQGDGAHGGDLHGAGDRRRADVQGSTEDKREAENIVDLIWIIAAARRDDRIAAHRPYLLGEDFGSRIGQRQNQRPLGHFPHHRLFQYATGRQSEKRIGAGDDVVEDPGVGGLGVPSFLRIH